MKKEFIMYVAYKTAEDITGSRRGRFNQFGRAKSLIAFTLALNLVELLLILNLLVFHLQIKFSVVHYWALALLPLIFLGVVNVFFTKATLAKALKNYKETSYATTGRGLGLGYIIFNLIITVILISQTK